MLREHFEKVRGRYYASVTGKITMFFEVSGSKQCSIYFIQQDFCLYHDPAGLKMFKKEDETFITECCQELCKDGQVAG